MVIFLLFREFWCWYWKINERIALEKKILAALISSGVSAPTTSETRADLSARTAGAGKTGIVLQADDGLTVQSVVAGSAAARAGLLAGDRLLDIDGEPAGDSVQANVLRLVGTPGTTVRVRVRRRDSVLDFDITRAK